MKGRHVEQGTRHHTRTNWMANATGHSNHTRRAKCITTTMTGPPMTHDNTRDFNRSDTNVPTVVLLNPNRSSTTNVENRLKGSDTTVSNSISCKQNSSELAVGDDGNPHAAAQTVALSQTNGYRPLKYAAISINRETVD